MGLFGAAATTRRRRLFTFHRAGRLSRPPRAPSAPAPLDTDDSTVTADGTQGFCLGVRSTWCLVRGPRSVVGGPWVTVQPCTPVSEGTPEDRDRTARSR